MNRLLIMKTGDVEKCNVETNLDILITGNIGMKEFKEIVATIKEKNANIGMFLYCIKKSVYLF